MSFQFINMLLLPLLALAAIPLVLHLFARSKPPAYRFSSNEFIQGIVRTTIRLKRPKDILLLIIRTLACLALAGIFLRPILFSHHNLSAPNRQRSVVILVDASASMSYMDGSQTRFALACAEASEVLSGLKASDTANIVWMRAHPTSVFPEPGINVAYLKAELRAARATLEPADVDAAVALACKRLEGATGSRELCIISDFQASAWNSRRLNVPQDVALLGIKVGTDDAANPAITDVRIQPPQPLLGEEIEVHCEVANYSGQPRREAIYFSLGETRERVERVLAPWQKSVAVFKCRPATAGAVPIQLSLDEDPFPGDNERHAILQVRETLRVGILSNQTLNATYWQKALEASGWARCMTLTTGDLTRLPELDALLLDGWDGTGSGVLDFIQRGGSVLWAPPRDMPRGRLQLTASNTLDNTPLAWESSRDPHRLVLADSKDPAFTIFSGGEYGDPARALFNGRLIVPAESIPASRALLRYDDGVPALARMNPAGNLILWNIPLNPEFSTLSRHTEFLMLLCELLLTGRTTSLTDAQPLQPGTPLSLAISRDIAPGDVVVETAAGKREPLTPTAHGGVVTLHTPPISETGLYTWKLHDQVLDFSIVNFPAGESDLRSLPAEDIQRNGVVVAGAGDGVKRLRHGTEIWQHLLLLLVACLVLEGVVSMWAEKK